MSYESWTDSANRRLARLFAELPPGLSEAEVRRAVRDAYPWGERRYWPYKAWLKQARAWRAAYKLGLKGPLPSRGLRRGPRSAGGQGDLFGAGRRGTGGAE